MPDTFVNQKSEADSVASLVKASQTPSHFASRTGVVVLPNGGKINLEDERFSSAPWRKRASVSLYEAKSFINYVNAHKIDGRTELFGKATEQNASFRAIIDYHQAESAVPNTTIAQPGWGEHSVTLELVTTPEWRRWIENNNRYMAQEAFAEFLEDNLTDIVRPDAGILIDVAQLLTGKKSAMFKSGKNLKDGAITFEYSEVIETNGNRVNGDAKVPDKFTLGIVPFVGANGIELDARLRFRITDQGKLSFAYILNRPFQVIEQAFQAARDDIEKDTALKVHLGTGQIPTPQYISS